MSRHRHSDRCGRRQRPRDLEELLARKRELIERSAGQRRALAEATAGLLPAFALGDRAVGAWRSLLSHPLLLVGAGAFLIALFPRAAFSLARRGLAAWTGLRAARRLLALHC